MKRKLKKKKIVLVLPDVRVGGAQKMFVNMAHAFSDIGHNVVLLALTKQNDINDTIDINGQFRFISFPHKRVRESFFSYYRFLKVENPDLIISALTYVNCLSVIVYKLSALKKAVLVVTERAYHSINANTGFWRFHIEKLCMRLLYPHAGRVVGISKGVSQDIISTAGLKDDLVQTIYNPVITNSTYENLTESYVSSRYQNFNTVVVACGRLVAIKDYPTMLRGFALFLKQNPSSLLVILGDGPMKDELQALTRSLGISENVVFEGFVSNPLQYFNIADVFVMTSLSEGFGNVIVEALYARLPIISTDCPSGPREILGDDVFGKLIPVGDYRALGEALGNILSKTTDKDLLRARAVEFSADTICKHYEDVYDTIRAGSTA